MLKKYIIHNYIYIPNILKKLLRTITKTYYIDCPAQVICQDMVIVLRHLIDSTNMDAANSVTDIVAFSPNKNLRPTHHGTICEAD